MTNATLPTIGWIGAGRMGAALVRRMLAAGYDVAVYNRTRAKAEELVAAGATVADSPVSLADRDVVFICVAASDDLVDVTLGANGLLTDPARAPRYVGDVSTVSLEASAQVRAAAEARGTGFLATPVSGNPKVIKSGKLTVAASGPRAVYDALEPALATWGRGTTYVGEGEVARIVKIAHNVFLGIVAQSMAEITVLAESYGVPRAAFLEFLNNSVMGSDFTRYKSPAYVNLTFAPTFTPVLLQKDLDLGLAAAAKTGVVMPVSSLTRNLVAQEVGRGNTDADFASLILTVAHGSGLDIQPESAVVDDGLGG
jgi:3-hydroxyisobutyrate dehydrogenase-like beta-hydroxyacid dehydrogenase